MRRYHRKGTVPTDNQVFYNRTKLNENVTIDNNPAYDVTKANTVGSLYSTIKPGDSDVPLTANPSYAVPTKPYSKAASENEYLQLNQHSNLEVTIKTDTNPSYGVTTGGDGATGFSAHSNTKAATKQDDYDYVCEDRLLHLNKTASTTGEAKRDIPASVDQSQYMENVHPVSIADNTQPSSDGEYGVVNQPISDVLDNDNDLNGHFHSPKSVQLNTVYGVVNQPKSDGLDNENAKGQIHDQSNHTATTYLLSPPLHANGAEPNGGYGVVNQYKSDDPNL